MQKIGKWIFIIVFSVAVPQSYAVGSKDIDVVSYPSMAVHPMIISSISRDRHGEGPFVYSIESTERDSIEKELDKLREEMKRLEKEFKEKFEKEILPRIRRELEKLRELLKEFPFEEEDSGPLKTDKKQI
ncbi:MAG: hypothetical protein JRJ85_26730 [Deltaproteobacteria bacterium]|nr:hypothetical protein [Deltaproteobacteria bacterium]